MGVAAGDPVIRLQDFRQEQRPFFCEFQIGGGGLPFTDDEKEDVRGVVPHFDLAGQELRRQDVPFFGVPVPDDVFPLVFEQGFPGRSGGEEVGRKAEQQCERDLQALPGTRSRFSGSPPRLQIVKGEESGDVGQQELEQGDAQIPEDRQQHGRRVQLPVQELQRDFKVEEQRRQGREKRRRPAERPDMPASAEKEIGQNPESAPAEPEADRKNAVPEHDVIVIVVQPVDRHADDRQEQIREIVVFPQLRAEPRPADQLREECAECRGIENV